MGSRGLQRRMLQVFSLCKTDLCGPSPSFRLPFASISFFFPLPYRVFK
jgi:hypothetical protein